MKLLGDGNWQCPRHVKFQRVMTHFERIRSIRKPKPDSYYITRQQESMTLLYSSFLVLIAVCQESPPTILTRE